MAAPNENKKLNFVAKVRDPSSGDFRPIYIAPDATDKVQGDVWLSDDYESSALDAQTGMTAATPLAVNKVWEETQTKLSTIDENPQSVNSDVHFGSSISVKGVIDGELEGNARTASALQIPVTLNVRVSSAGEVGSAEFQNGGDTATVTIPSVPATCLNGVIPLANIPQGAIEKLVHVANQAARFKLDTSSVQTGDTVLQDDTGIMYIVVDDTKLSSADGYQEYKAGMAAKASEATKDSSGQQINSTYIKGLSVSGTTITYTRGDNSTGTITTQDTNTTYSAGAGISLSGTTFSNSGVRSIATGSANGTISVNTNGTTANVSVKGLGSAAYTNSTAYAAASHTHNYAGSSSAGGAANSVVDGAITLPKLASTVGTVSIGTTTPTDSHILFWVDTN